MKVWQVVIPCSLVFPLIFPDNGLAWGARGHALITEVAVRLTEERLKEQAELWSPFREKSWMLSHLSNIPDTYWRSLPQGVTSLLNPTHFIDLEYFGMKSFSDVRSLRIPEAIRLARQHCQNSGLSVKMNCTDQAPSGPHDLALLRETGSAPWRIAELHDDLVASLRNVALSVSSKKKAKMGKKAEEVVNQALVTAGILSHFVGDLAQPHHTTADYDSFQVGQGGLHAYFETEVVEELGLSLVAEVHERSRRMSRADFVQSKSMNGNTALDWAFLLAADSYSEVAVLNRIDKTAAVIRPSKESDGLRIPAERRLPGDPKVLTAFKEFVIERLARAAFVLAELYRQSWELAGKPDLSAYQSYYFAHQPEPVIPRYLQ